MKLQKKSHGGYREGSGRKARRGDTVVKRIPYRYKEAVAALIEHLDGTIGQPGDTGYVTNVNCRNLNDSLITLQFQSTSRKRRM